MSTKDLDLLNDRSEKGGHGVFFYYTYIMRNFQNKVTVVNSVTSRPLYPEIFRKRSLSIYRTY